MLIMVFEIAAVALLPLLTPCDLSYAKAKQQPHTARRLAMNNSLFTFTRCV